MYKNVTILILIYEYLLSKQVHGMQAKNSEKGLIWIVEMVTMGRFVFINIMVHIVWFPKTRLCDPLEAGQAAKAKCFLCPQNVKGKDDYKTHLEEGHNHRCRKNLLSGNAMKLSENFCQKFNFCFLKIKNYGT